MTRTVAVVGGGIGGLAAAIGLQSQGWDVTVFERAVGLPETGTGLGIWPEALRALDRLGLGERARAEGVEQGDGVISRPDGSRIASISVSRVRRRTGEGVYLLRRPVLLRLLADGLLPGTVRFGCAVTEVDELRRTYDVVVGADGIRSGVRTRTFGGRYGLRYAGGVVWRGSADVEVARAGETWGRGRKFGVTPQGGGSTNFYGVLYGPSRIASGEVDVAELRRLFEGWHDPVPAVLAAVDEGGVLRHELNYLDPPLPSYVAGNVVLVGDAAHAMTPDLGQGACQALIDGTALAECLGDEAEVAAGLAAYDRARRRPSQRVAAMARRVGWLAGVRWTGVRDVVVRLASGVV